MKHKIALYIISSYNRWQNCWDAFLKRSVLWCPDKGTPHPSPLPQMVVSELNRTRQAQKQYKGKKVRWEQGIPPLFSLILSNFLPAPYYLYAWNRLISSLSFATQYLQTTRKRLYSDNSIQSSAYIKWIQNTSLQLPSYREDLTLLDLNCLFVCLFVMVVVVVVDVPLQIMWLYCKECSLSIQNWSYSCWHVANIFNETDIWAISI